MQQLMRVLKQVLRQGIVFSLTVMLGWSSLAAVTAPSYAASSELSPEDKIDRAYEYTERAGFEEEVYQKRLEEGQDPEAMPKPYRRVTNVEGQEVPDTSLVEKTVGKVREIIEGGSK